MAKKKQEPVIKTGIIAIFGMERLPRSLIIIAIGLIILSLAAIFGNTSLPISLQQLTSTSTSSSSPATGINIGFVQQSANDKPQNTALPPQSFNAPPIPTAVGEWKDYPTMEPDNRRDWSK